MVQGKYKVLLADVPKQLVLRSRQTLDEIVAENRVVYGVTTGFGNFANVCIAQDKPSCSRTSFTRTAAVRARR